MTGSTNLNFENSDKYSTLAIETSSSEDNIVYSSNDDRNLVLDINKKLVFGSIKASLFDYESHIRDDDSKPKELVYDGFDYMTNGGGRYVYPSTFGFVEKFFEDSDSDSKNASVYQYITGIGSADWAERSLVFGTTGFNVKIDQDKSNAEILNLAVFPDRDNYDFESSTPFIEELMSCF
ncbi:MAG: hypothetical protein F6K29_33200 [Okeania sp. SIO2G5]|nr:hypothetical protein [Okeania sp. SIO2G5]